jgi:DNA-binding NarL/FixJ family response regulator
MNEKKISVLLADDALIAREGWKRILETAPDVQVIGEATMIYEALGKVSELEPDVVLMDLKWSGDVTAGWTTIQDIKSSFPRVKIVAITAYENLIRDARLAGADGALIKEFTREELLGLIRELAVKKESPNRIEFGERIVEQLSAREREVLLLLARGLRDKEIAKSLGISPATAKNHVKHILAKLGAKNRLEASNVARERGMID